MTDSRIVVGDDGSKAAAVAIRHAAALAGDLGVDLEVVRAWTLRNAPRPKDAALTHVPSEAEYEQAVRENLASDVAALGLPVEPTLTAVRGASSAALLKAAAGARILVVGSRGAGGFAGLLMGSTAEQVVRHATVPVLVVPVEKVADAT